MPHGHCIQSVGSHWWETYFDRVPGRDDNPLPRLLQQEQEDVIQEKQEDAPKDPNRQKAQKTDFWCFQRFFDLYTSRQNAANETLYEILQCFCGREDFWCLHHLLCYVLRKRCHKNAASCGAAKMPQNLTKWFFAMLQCCAYKWQTRKKSKNPFIMLLGRNKNHLKNKMLDKIKKRSGKI